MVPSDQITIAHSCAASPVGEAPALPRSSRSKWACESWPSNGLAEGMAYFCLDERLHPFTPGQAQPERSPFGLHLKGEAEEGTAISFLVDEGCNRRQWGGLSLQAERIAGGNLLDLLHGSKKLLACRDVLLSLGRRDRVHVAGKGGLWNGASVFHDQSSARSKEQPPISKNAARRKSPSGWMTPMRRGSLAGGGKNRHALSGLFKRRPGGEPPGRGEGLLAAGNLVVEVTRFLQGDVEPGLRGQRIRVHREQRVAGADAQLLLIDHDLDRAVRVVHDLIELAIVEQGVVRAGDRILVEVRIGVAAGPGADVQAHIAP